ncbi:Uncharacterized protein FKW44_013120 [Caligus rogercresseyi]|uniref:ISXO2-like transposase domain-containing protein n=1 Tax=Caligus rogercresseyi TaxID=217165 RepID=A0A7T8KAS6_CALRO|nr:Uncharacterized protein FKW44_013120 [Caligus rogercresseyi]
MDEVYEATKDVISARQFLQIRGCLRFYPPTCPTCERSMSFVKHKENVMKWRCATHKNNTILEKKDSFWEGSHLSYSQIIKLVCAWALKIPLTTVPHMFDITTKTAIMWYKSFRDVCSQILNRYPYKIGGPGMVVQIDESLMAKRKYHRGHLVPERWVFGGYCPNTKEGFLFMVENRSATVLLPLIVENAAYGGIPQLPVLPPFQHEVVNHSQNFVDPGTGAHTNNVECYWKNAKRRFKSMAGVHDTTLSGHLDEFKWREKYGRSPREAFDNLFKQIAELYQF